MGGKSKKAERTKNNARPSSSSHCAKLLGSNIPIFCDFSTESFFAPTEELSSNIDINFQLVLKKLNKKNSVTKLKALQEFADLCKGSDVETIKTILPIWPKLYRSLCTDTEHKVREAAHISHGVIVEKLKKSIAPYLKQLAGPWFTSQYDNYPPAASAAVMAFEQAFPPEKQNKVIMFCQEEILNYIYESLIVHTMQTLCNPKTTKPEEMEAKYHRVVIGSLQGYSLYLQKLSCDQIKEAEESNKKIVSSPKFWEYSKNKAPLIRNSFFNVFIALCQNAKFLLSNEMKRVTVAIFNDLDDSNAMVMACVWDAALNALVFLDDCWAHVNFEKQVFPKLKAIIKKGGRNAITIIPTMLPLFLRKIPHDLIKDSSSFCDRMLEIMTSVIVTSSATAVSVSDARTLTATFADCLKYILDRFVSEGSFSANLVSNHLLKNLDKSLSATKCVAPPIAVALFSETSKLLRYWHSNSHSNKMYSDVLRIFWESLPRIYESGLQSCENLSEVLRNHIEFLIILRDPQKHCLKPKKTLKFAEDEISRNVVEKADKEERVVVVANDEFNDAEFKRELLAFAKKIAATYLKKSIDEETNAYIPSINEIVNAFDSGVILQELVASRNEPSLYSLFENLFCKWMESPGMRRGEVVDLSFTLLRHLGKKEKDMMLEKLCEDWSKNELRQDVCRCLLNHSSDESVRCWIMSEAFSNHLLSLTKDFIDSDVDDAAVHDIISTFLKAKDSSGEFVIGSETASSVVDLVSRSVKSSDVKDHVRKLAQTLVENGPSMKTRYRRSLERLVIALFKLSCHRANDEGLNSALGIGVRLVLTDCDDLAAKLADAIVEVIMSDDGNPSADDFVSQISYFLTLSIADEDLGETVDAIKQFLREPATVTTWRGQLKKCSLAGFESVGDWDLTFIDLMKREPQSTASSTALAEMLSEIRCGFGGFAKSLREDYPSDDFLKLVVDYYTCFSRGQPIESDITRDMIVNFARWHVYVGSVLNLLASRANNPNALTQTSGIVPAVIGEVLDFIYSICLLVCFEKNFASTKYYSHVKDFTTRLKNIGREFLMRISDPEIGLLQYTCEKLADEDVYWRMIVPALEGLFDLELRVQERKMDGHKMRDFVRGHELSSSFVETTTLVKLQSMLNSEEISVIDEDEWNEIFIYLHKFFSDFELGNGISEENRLKLAAISRITLMLMQMFEENDSRPVEKRISTEACLAWKQVVRAEMWNGFFAIWQELADTWYDREVPPEVHVIVQSVSEIIVAGSDCSSCDIDDAVQLALKYVRYMSSSCTLLQISSFHLLRRLVPDLVKLDADMFCDNKSKVSEDVKEGSMKTWKCDWTCKAMEKVIAERQGIVETLLSDFVIGDCCSVEPFTDSFNYTYSYLLIWCFLLDMCGEAHSSLRFQYGFWLRDQGFANPLLESTLKLMPQAMIHSSEVKDKCLKLFEEFPREKLREPVTSSRIESMSCFVYRMFLQRLPNVARGWWSQSENKTLSTVDRITSLYVSPILIANELKNLQQERGVSCFDNLEIKTHANARGIVATYTVDDIKMDLIMTLPQNYPLGTISIESSNAVVSSSSLRSWLFHMSRHLIHQNGTIGEAVVMWKNNLDKKFEGVEECYICASILSGNTFEIPRVCCKICKKKFHSHCLYKWFSTSNNASCPICRNIF